MTRSASSAPIHSLGPSAPLGPPPPIYLRMPSGRGPPGGEGAGVPLSTTVLAARTQAGPSAVEGTAVGGGAS